MRHTPFPSARRAARAALLVAPLLAAPALAEPPAVPAVELDFAGGRAVAERFALPAGLRAELAGAKHGETLPLAAFPVAPGFRAALELQRVEAWAPGARPHLVDAAGERPLAPTGRLFFRGHGRDDEALRVGFSFDPASGELSGLTRGPAGFYELRGAKGAYSVVDPSTLLPQGTELEYGGCGTDELAAPGSVAAAMGTTAPILVKAALPALQAVVAVDTDSSFMAEKFSNGTGAATAWIEDLFVEMNVLYERDLSLRLLIGDTFLRVGGDPYGQNGSGASSAHLAEFGSFWEANMGHVDRAFAMLLSGNASSGFSSSGIAWLDGYCEQQSTGGGYSVTQVFTANVSVANDLRVVAHELGHNLGSPHTHCYTPTPVDRCFNLQSGCYSGPTSCPVGGSGTLMSYCHVGACGTANLAELHPTVAGLLDAFVAAHTPACIAPLGASDVIFANGFESGTTAAWSG